MELRTTEEKIDELALLYGAMRQSPILNKEQVDLLPPLPIRSPTSISITSNDPASSTSTVESIGTNNIDHNSISATLPPPTSSFHSTVPSPPPSTLADLVQAIDMIESSLIEWQPKVNKFRKRLTEIDPVTEKPRYGPKSYERVVKLVEIYDFLCQIHVQQQQQHQEEDPPHGQEVDDSRKGTSVIGGDKNSILLFREMQKQHIQQIDSQRMEEALTDQQRRKEEEEQQRKVEQAREEEVALERARVAQMVAERAAEVERVRQQAEQVRQRRRGQWEAQQQSERDWVNSIVKGAEGVELYIRQLKDTTADNVVAQSKALTSMFMIFDQIQRHPEEVNFRKIRLSHEGFHNDIGRHKGGIELLIAAGFRPTKLPTTSGENNGDGGGGGSINNANANEGNDDNDAGAGLDVEVPTTACLVSNEPNLETDMDGWSAWYDLNKATFDILQTEVQKLKKR
jgi:hypothetical protein